MTGRHESQSKLASQGYVSWLISRIIPAGGFWAGFFNLASASLGAGIMGLPYGFFLTGWLMGCLYLVSIAAMTVYSVWLICVAAKKTSIRSYEGMARDLLGRGGDIAASLVVSLLCFGACIAYVIVVMNMIGSVQQKFNSHDFWAGLGGQRLITALIWFFTMLPLSLPKEINALRYISAAGVAFIVFFMLCIVGYAVQYVVQNGVNLSIKPVVTGNRAVNGMAVFVFSYLCHPNVFEVWNEKPNPTASALLKECFWSMLATTILYLFTGLFGYLQFGDAVPDVILSKYNPLVQIPIAIANIGIIVKLCTSFALHILPIRDTIYYFLNWNLWDVPMWINCLLCAALSTAAALIGIFFASASVIFGLVGGLCGGFVGFIFPALFIMYAGNWSRKEVGWVHFITTYFILFVGVVGVVFGTVGALYGQFFEK